MQSLLSLNYGCTKSHYFTMRRSSSWIEMADVGLEREVWGSVLEMQPRVVNMDVCVGIGGAAQE